MKHYINPTTKEVFAYEDDGSQDHIITENFTPISDTDLAALRASQIDPKAAIKAHIASLEASITPRRLREAVLSGDHAFITGVDAHIEALRAKL